MDTAHRVTRRLSGRLALLVLGGALAVATGGCGQGAGQGTAAGTPSPSVTGGNGGIGGAPDGTASASADPTSGPGGQSGKPNGGGGNSGGNQTPGSHSTTTAPAGTSGPSIVYFRIKQQPKCPQGTNQYPVPGIPLIIEWKVTGADKVDLSVDGPGLYNTYGPQGQETFNFGCGGTPGSTEQHTYSIKTENGGVTRSKTITASAVVYEIAQV